jgi:heme/copper-type cytochrome/quinol oxidase subunit 2
MGSKEFCEHWSFKNNAAPLILALVLLVVVVVWSLLPVIILCAVGYLAYRILKARSEEHEEKKHSSRI